MRGNGFFLIIVIGTMMLQAAVGLADGSERRLVQSLLIAEGIDPARAESILQDPRVTVRQDIVIKNLFHSKPKTGKSGSDVMDIDPGQIDQGKVFMGKNMAVLSAVEERFGASSRIITAILIVESRLGTYPMPHNVANAYVNLAFLADPDYLKGIQDRYGEAYPQLKEEATVARAQKKAKWAINELAYLIHLADHLNVDPFSLSGSFAGAMGPAQFIPSSFWIFGMDGNVDGTASPFHMTDAVFSMGQYLKKYGWREDAPVEQKRRALWYYNRSDVYVNTVLMIYSKLEKQ